MLTKFAFAALISFAINATAQINTNLVESVPWFRDVDGKLYNTRLSVLWLTVEGRVEQVLTNGVILQTFKTNKTYAYVFVPGNGGPAGAYGSTGSRNVRKPVSSDEVPDRVLFIQHPQTNYVDGERISIKAMKTGSIKIEDETIETWDCGTVHRGAPTTNKPK